MLEFARASEGEKLYCPRRARLWCAAIFFIIVGTSIGWPVLREIVLWRHGGTPPSPRSLFMLLTGFASLGMGVLAVAGVLRGLPRLMVTPAGVTLRTNFGTKWADWASLAVFELTTIYAGPLRRRVLSATARVVGSGASKGLLRSKNFVIPDAFLMPIETIVFDLRAQHGQISGVAAAPDRPTEQTAAPFAATGTNVPWLTFLILAVLVAVFVGEQRFALDPTGRLLQPGNGTLLALGGLNRTVTLSNAEWYRLFAAPLLHLDISHLVFNGIALLMAGFLLERLVGRLWFFALFVLGALGGSLMSLALNPGTITSVGASGAIMGLFAAAFTSSFRLPAGTKARWWTQIGSVRVLIPSLLPLATTSEITIDYGAHFGGALSGALVALLLIRTWPDTARWPRFRPLAAGVAIAGLVLFVASSAAVASHYPQYRVLASLIPRDRMPRTDADIKNQAEMLVARYPLDPRSRMYRGIALSAAKDYDGAEREARIALQQAENLRFIFVGREFENAIRFVLAAILLEADRQPEAKEAAHPLCQAFPAGYPNEKLQRILTEGRLCD